VERDYLSVDDLSPKELSELLDLAADVKARPEAYEGRLTGRSIALIFEKPSTRTRVSFPNKRKRSFAPGSTGASRSTSRSSSATLKAFGLRCARSRRTGFVYRSSGRTTQSPVFRSSGTEEGIW
jgi:hypothetical protein